VENGAWAYVLSLYVHLNPLRVGGLGLDQARSSGGGEGVAHADGRKQVTKRVRQLRAYGVEFAYAGVRGLRGGAGVAGDGDLCLGRAAWRALQR